MTDFSTIQSEHAGTNKMCDQIPKIILCIAIVAIVCVFIMDMMYVYQKHKLDLQQQKNDIELGLKLSKGYENMKTQMIEQQIANQKTMTEIFSRMDYMKNEISYLNEEIRNKKDR